MPHPDTENFNIFAAAIAATGGACAFDGEGSVKCVRAMLDVIRDMGLDPNQTTDLKKGLYSLFNIVIVNAPDFDSSRYILSPNHVSDFDALILGLLHPKIRIVSKAEWTENAKLKPFLDLHYDLYGLDRTSLMSLRRLLKDSVSYFNDSDENRHFLVFSQGTISDFNNNSPERVSPIAPKLSDKTGVPIVCVFVEQVSLDHPTRIVFDSAMAYASKDDFRAVWLEREATLQNSLSPPARRPLLTFKHTHNNKPGDPFFEAKQKRAGRRKKK